LYTYLSTSGPEVGQDVREKVKFQKENSLDKWESSNCYHVQGLKTFKSSSLVLINKSLYSKI